VSQHTDQAQTIIASSNITFGTSGARGLVEQFSDDVCAAFTVAFLSALGPGISLKRVAIGIDRRPSSPQMAAACAGAAKALGISVNYYGILPTPALALQAMSDEIPAIMITGSHIPFDRNGIKFYRPDGEITKTDENLIIHSDAPLPNYLSALPDTSSRASKNYIHRYTNLYPDNILAGLRIGLYEHSAAGRDLNIQILEQLGAEIVSLGRTEQFVPIDTEAVSEEDKTSGKQWAKQHQLDAIFSTDGDGDRPLLANEKGEWLKGDVLGLLCAQELGIEALAVPVSCNSAIEQSSQFTQVTRTRIGSPYVIEAMTQLAKKHNTVAGFEANGGFLLGSPLMTSTGSLQSLPTRDAILPILVALVAAKRNNTPLSGLTAALPDRYTASDRLTDFPTEHSKKLMTAWKASPESLKTDLKLPADIRAIDFMDGLRATLWNHQVVHIRPSGNAPELRCYCEAETPEQAEILLKKSLQALKQASMPPPNQE